MISHNMLLYDIIWYDFKKKSYQHRPQIAWQGISDILQFVSSRFTRCIFLHKCISGQETNQNTYIKYNQTEIFFNKNNTVNPHPYTHQMTPPSNDTLCDSPLLHLQTHDPYTHHDSFNDTLCDDSPVLDLQTRSSTHIRRLHLERHPVWQPSLGSANPQQYTHQKITPRTTPCVTAQSWICEPWPLHTPDDTSNKNSLCDSPPRNESTKSANPHPPTWSKNPYS